MDRRKLARKYDLEDGWYVRQSHFYLYCPHDNRHEAVSHLPEQILMFELRDGKIYKPSLVLTEDYTNEQLVVDEFPGCCFVHTKKGRVKLTYAALEHWQSKIKSERLMSNG